MAIETPWLINTNELEKLIDENKVTVIDISNKDSYALNHIQGAVFLDYASIVKHNPPVVGMLPDEEALSATLSQLGVSPDDYLVVYDEEGGGKAARLMWTQEICGHKKMSLLDGGIVSWLAEHKPVSQADFQLGQTNYPVKYTDMQGVANADYILQNLDNDAVQVLDTRTAAEFNGSDVRGPRGGHIPGAVNIDWLLFKDPQSQKLLDQDALKALLSNNGISKDKEIIVHCHSHHRSALSYVALKHLGFDKVKGYPASWSDWATRTDTPVTI